MVEKPIKRPRNNSDTNEILLAINENIGIVGLEVCSVLRKVRESNEEIIRALKKRK